MAESDQTMPLECSDVENQQSVPCPPMDNQPGPTCDPNGTLPTPVAEPQQPEIHPGNGGPPGPIVRTTPPGCGEINIGYKEAEAQNTPGLTQTGPGFKMQVGFCNPGSFDLNAEGSAGKMTYKNGQNTVEAEGPNARAGLSINPGGTSWLGGQANTASATHEISGSQSSAKYGVSTGVGGEVRWHNGEQRGYGFDAGPFSFDAKQNRPVAR